MPDSGPSYAAMIDRARQKKGFTIEQLSVLAEYSYEHVRKVLAGKPVASPAFNRKLAEALDLDPEALWKIAEREKVSAKLQRRSGQRSTADAKLAELWARLDAPDRQRLLRYAEALVVTADAQKVVASK